MSSQDGRDAHDLVEWLAVQPFSDGRIGQIGESYGGQTSYGAAVERPPHLVAVAPMQPPSNLYDDVIYRGGIKSTEGGVMDNWPEFSPLLSAGGVDAEAEYAANRAHPTFDAYWQDRNLLDRYDQIEVPVLTLGGWDDGFFRSGALAAIERAPERTWAIYGPWPHLPLIAFEDPCLLCPGDPLPSGVLLAWFDHWIKQLPEAAVIPAQPTFVSYEGPVGVGAGWQELSWDPAGRDVATFQLGAGGELARRATKGTVEFAEPAEPTDPGGSVSFTTAAFERDRVLEGHPRLSLRAALSASDANLYVEVIDVAGDGHEIVVNDGFLRASHRSSHIDPEPVPPGTFVDYEIAVRADDHRFVAGHRLRLRISGGASTMLVPVAAPVTVTVEAGRGSVLAMPGFARR
jgi:predicted acyl esterase